MKKTNSSQKGQIALIIILLMVVIGTIALAVVSRSVVDIGISKQEENKIRAFSKAEAGIEDLLSEGLINIGVSQGTRTVGSVDYKYTIETVGSGPGGWQLDEPLVNSEITEIKLPGGSSNPGSVDIYWVNSAASDQIIPPLAALEISVYNSDNTVKRFAVAADTSQNGFATAGTGGHFGSRDYQLKYNVTLVANDVSIRIKALYNKTSLAVKPNDGELPVQGYRARVTGQEGDNSAAVEIVQALPANAGIFDYLLWSGAGLTK